MFCKLLLQLSAYVAVNRKGEVKVISGRKDDFEVGIKDGDSFTILG